MVRPRLPPLNAIKAFEAAARLGSFTRAAEELNVTHGAISRQIRLLEDWLGIRLFLRTSRNAVPTQTGKDLLAEAGPALDRVAIVCQRLQNRVPATAVLRLSALPTFAMRWLIPRLPEFQRDHPGLDLQIVTASTPAEQFGMDADAVISGPWRQSGWIGKRFLGEARLPVLSFKTGRRVRRGVPGQNYCCTPGRQARNYSSLPRSRPVGLDKGYRLTHSVCRSLIQRPKCDTSVMIRSIGMSKGCG